MPDSTAPFTLSIGSPLKQASSEKTLLPIIFLHLQTAFIVVQPHPPWECHSTRNNLPTGGLGITYAHVRKAGMESLKTQQKRAHHLQLGHKPLANGQALWNVHCCILGSTNVHQQSHHILKSTQKATAFFKWPHSPDPHTLATNGHICIAGLWGYIPNLQLNPRYSLLAHVFMSIAAQLHTCFHLSSLAGLQRYWSGQTLTSHGHM